MYVLIFWTFNLKNSKMLVFISIPRSGEVLSEKKILLGKLWRNSKELLSPKMKTQQRQVHIYLYTTGNVSF